MTNLYYVLISIQCYTIIGLFIESWIVFKNWKNMLHSYLFLSCFVTLIYNIGYLLEMTAKTEGAYITALKFCQTGGVWIALSLFVFSASLCRIRIPAFLSRILVPLHLAFYAVILTFQYHHLYYTSYHFEHSGKFGMFYRANGIVHHLYVALQVVYIIFGLYWLFITYLKEKKENAPNRKRLITVFFAMLSESGFFLIKTVNPFGVNRYYDLTMLGFFLGTVIMLIAIFSFNLLETDEIAREFAIDRLSEGVIAVDRNGRIQYFNKTAKRLYPKLKSGEAALPSGIGEAIESGEHITISGRIYHAEENDLISNGENYGKLYALVDETDHIRYMEELERQKKLADRASEAKSRFLANMSHEIRTPINAVLGMDEMILRESRESSVRSYAANIMSAGRTLLSLINDILDLSRVEEGRMEIVPVHYELSSLINDLFNLIHDRAAKAGLKFSVTVDEHIPHLLCGDEIRIRQCVLNLLTNAVKYTEAGSVTMTVFFEKKDESHILLGFTVEDTGIGMKKEDMEALFSPYRRIDEERNRSIEGTGLGMSITKQLLSLMGSELMVESEYGKGSRLSFAVEQEVVSWEEAGPNALKFGDTDREVGAYHELFHAPEARILVVDDTEMNLTVMESLLKKTEIRIDTALSGSDALTLAAGNVYDVIFIDHMMPGMDGIETLKHLREEGKNQTTPAIALTANAVSGARKLYLDAGFTDYISKPVDGVKLEKLLYILLPDEKLNKSSPAGEIQRESLISDSSKILLIDDDEAVGTLVKSIMEPLYDIRICLSGLEAVSEAKKYSPDLILLDIHLSDGNGFAVMQELKSETQTAGIPVLMLTGDNDSVTEENGFKSGASDYIRKPFVPDVLMQRVKRIIDLHHYQQSIEEEVERQTGRSRRLTREMMLALSKTVDTKDHYTDGHSRRVAAMSAELARRLGKSDTEQVMLYEIGLLHDIGKIGVHEDIIHKDSRLTDDEYLEIKDHTVKGYEILKEIVDMPKLREGARWHHEHFDGTGYPDGLKGEDIPETARIVCVADCYDAMTSTRTYSEPRKQSEVRAEIERCRGTYFDPQISDIMLTIIDEDNNYRMNEHAQSSDVWKEYDRLWGNLSAEVAEKEVPPPAGQSVLPEWLETLTELDVRKGIKNCGSEEGYLSVLAVFHRTAEQKADEIEKLFNTGDTENYTIRVHALKSSARIIGASDLSALAEKLEVAGKEGDTEFINENTAALLSEYRELDKHLSAMDSESRSLPGIEAGAMKEAYQTIAEIADAMDYALMEELLKNLRTYRLAPADEKTVGSIEKMLTELDWEGITQAAEKALS
ncbi:MAG: response regulator [Lachnospiraceae bacterium]|nr:response regulator [Lachnospiraceae bacterium]